MNSVVFYDVGPPLPAGETAPVRLATTESTMSVANIFVVPALRTLDVDDLGEDALRARLCVIAGGKTVVARSDFARDLTPLPHGHPAA